MYQDTAEIAAHDHQTESEGIASIDQMWRLGASSTQAIHRSPNTWGTEVAETKNGHVEKGGAIPFHFVLSATHLKDLEANTNDTWIATLLYFYFAARLWRSTVFRHVKETKSIVGQTLKD